MDVIERIRFQDVIEEIGSLDFASLTSDEMMGVTWAYYYFSIQFRESLVAARTLHPDDVKLRQLEREECNTDNLSPWPSVAAVGETLNHDEFMRRTLTLVPISEERVRFYNSVGEAYLAKSRAMDLETRALSIASYEDGGLETVFRNILTYQRWNNPLLRAFEHFLVQHVKFDSDPDEGHGALSRHLIPDDRIIPLWQGFRDLFLSCVPSLRG